MLAGGQAEDFLLIRDILERTQKVILPELDRASSQSEAKTLLRRGHSGPVWFEHEMGDAATKLLAEFLQTGCRVPSIVLAELAAEKPSPTLSRREPGTVLRNRSAMELTGCAPSAAR